MKSAFNIRTQVNNIINEVSYCDTALMCLFKYQNSNNFNNTYMYTDVQNHNKTQTDNSFSYTKTKITLYNFYY